MKRKLSAFVTILVALAGLLVVAAPVHAASTQGTATQAVSALGVKSAWYRPADGPRESDGCRINLDGPLDPLLVCGSQYTIIEWWDGRWEVFGLGTDRQIWHTWQTAPGSAYIPWTALGGYQLNSWGVGLKDSVPTIIVRGGNGVDYCKRFNGNGGWYDWFAC
ncbi:hypothetical protein [Streptomyces sp. H39-S7]|uniref:hypothetical protein n=1 Tax=Streptomyces sp. H39-S7 TaxID=3004357 RepID=UPI0022AFF67C|nr:hypothetical protein [Streptomyces sp. H39-S7]MCZ4122795.1 hypothetical protein [Streptomyces sp. H39-S7]